MKKIISKILIILIIFIMMFEVIFSSNICYALNPSEDVINGITNLAGGIVSIIYWPKRLMIVGISFIINMITSNMALSTGVNYGSTSVLSVITPFDIFFNRYQLLDVNVFDIEGAKDGTVTEIMRTTVSGWYYAMRAIAAAILMLILLYVGIRMAISSVAEEKARYKKMLFDWICSLALIFILQYIAVFVIYTNNAIVNVLRSLMDSMSKATLAPGAGLIEDQMTKLIIQIGTQGILGIGIPSMAAVLVFVFIVFQTIAFLIAYINRMIKVAFLVMISPLISITYSIDKMGDGKAQALGNWLKEFIYTILIQPFHCLMYMAFVRTAFALITSNGNILSLQALANPLELFLSPDFNQIANGVLAILCLKFINDGEQIIRKIFGFQDDNSLTGMAAGMAVGMMAVKNAKKIGNTARKGINMAKSGTQRLSKAINLDSKKLANTKIGQFAGNQMDKLGKFADGAAKKFSNTKVGQGISAAGRGIDKFAQSDFAKGVANFGNKTIKGAKSLPNKLTNNKFTNSKFGQFMKRHNSMASTLAIMGAAMSYSTGTSGAMEAYGVGAAVGEGADEFFKTSKGHLSDVSAGHQTDEEQKAYDELQDTIEDLDNDDVVDAMKDYDEANDHTNKAAEAQKGMEQTQARKSELESKQANGEKLSDEETAELAGADKKIADQRAAMEAEQMLAMESLRRAKEKDSKLGGRAEDLYDRQGFADQDGPFNKKVEDAQKRASELDASFFDQQSVEGRFRKRSRSPKDSDIEAKKNEIIRKLTRIALMNKSSKDSKQITTINSDEQDTIERTAEMLVGNITRGVLSGHKYTQQDQEAYVKNALRLDSDAPGTSLDSLFRATSDYESLQRQGQIAQAHKNFAQVGGDSNSLTRAEMAKAGNVVRTSKELERAEKRKNQASQTTN